MISRNHGSTHMTQTYQNSRAFGSFDLVICVLAVFRLTRLLVDDKITEQFRMDIRNKTLDKPNLILFVLNELLSCKYCLGVWISIAVWITYHTPLWWIIYPFSIAGGQSVLEDHASL